mgnify:CR=1 FL=1
MASRPPRSAAASGSPPGSAAATASVDPGRLAGSRSRQRMITRSTAGSRSRTTDDGVGEAPLSCALIRSAIVFASKARRPVKISKSTQPERVDVAFDRRLRRGRRHDDRGARAPCTAASRRGSRSLSPAATARPKSVSRTLPVTVDHHVRRLQVAVEDAALVRGSQPGAELTREIDGLVLRDAANPAEQRREIFAVDVLHREEAAAVRFPEVVQPADVLVRHLPRAVRSSLWNCARCSSSAATVSGRNFRATG